MTTAQLLIVCLTAIVITAICAAARALPGLRRAPRRVGHRVTVHTKRPDDQTLYGVLAAEYGDRISLENAELVAADGGHPLPGRQDVLTRDISWIDVHQLVAQPERA